MSDVATQANDAGAVAIVEAAANLINALTHVQTTLRHLEERIAAIEDEVKKQHERNEWFYAHSNQ